MSKIIIPSIPAIDLVHAIILVQSQSPAAGITASVQRPTCKDKNKTLKIVHREQNQIRQTLVTV